MEPELDLAQSRERICMFVRNPFEHDSRVLKEGASLVEADYDVRLIAATAPHLPAIDTRAGIQVRRVAAQPRAMRAVAGLQRARSRRHGAAATVTGDGGQGRPEPASGQGRASGLTPLLSRVRRLAGAAYGSLAWWRYARSSYRAAVAEPAEIVIAHDLDTLPIARRAARSLGARLLYDSHEVFPELLLHGPLARRRWRMVERRLLRDVEATWMSSAGHAQVFAESHGSPVPPVIRNIPAAPSPPVGESRPDLHRELELRPELRIVLYIGGVGPHRPLDGMLEAVVELEDCAAVMMGPAVPGYVEHVRALAEQLGVADRVRLAPPVSIDDVVRYAAAADVGVIPFLNTSLNNFHGLPNKVFEYILAGIPVVASDFPQLRAVIDAHDVGVTFDPHAEGSLAAALSDLLGDPVAMDRYATNATAAARELNWDVESAKLLDVVARGDGPFALAARAVPDALRARS